jgi:ankyrin repeat protein
MEAVVTDHPELIRILLAYRANPALADREGRTAADLARQRGNQEAAELLAQLPSP